MRAYWSYKFFCEIPGWSRWQAFWWVLECRWHDRPFSRLWSLRRSIKRTEKKIGLPPRVDRRAANALSFGRMYGPLAGYYYRRSVGLPVFKGMDE